MACAGIHEDVVWCQCLTPLLFQVFEEKVSASICIERSPIDLAETTCVAFVLMPRRHYPQVATLFSNARTLVHVPTRIRRLAYQHVLADNFDDSWRGRDRLGEGVCVDAGRLQIEVDQQNTTPSQSELDTDIDECLSAAHATLERVKRCDVHKNALRMQLECLFSLHKLW